MVLSYQFTVPHNYDFTESAVLLAVQMCDSAAVTNPGGEFIFKISQGFGYFPLKFTLYISETNGITTLRILCNGIDGKKKRWFKTYDKFIIALMSCGIDVPISTGKPYIVTASQIGGGLEQEFTSRKGFSASGAIAGGMLFGDLGALMGAYSGKSRTKSKTVLSNSAFFLLCYSNGMIEEKEVQKNTKLYTEVMAKLNAKPVIRKQSIELLSKDESKQFFEDENNNPKSKKMFIFFCYLIISIFLATLKNKIISNIYIAICIILMLVTPILFIIWIIRLIARKQAKKFGIATIMCIVCLFIFFICVGISLS